MGMGLRGQIFYIRHLSPVGQENIVRKKWSILHSDEVGYPKTRNPRGITRTQKIKPYPKPDIQNIHSSKTQKPEGVTRW